MSLRDLAKRVNELTSKLYDYYVPQFSINKIYVSWDWIQARVKSLPKYSYWLLLDGRFHTCTVEDFNKIIRWDWSNVKKYVLDVFDCDDFGMYFKVRVALNFGVNAVAYVIDYGSGHAYNIIFPYDSDPLIYEPQADWLIKIHERDKRYYALENYVILI